MPTYPYACTECGHAFEVHQSFSDASLTECPQCSGRLRKVFSSVGVVFKGSGFYRTDSRSGSVAPGSGGSDGGKAAKGDSGSTSSSSSSSSSSSDGGSTSAAPAKPAASTSSGSSAPAAAATS